METLNGKLVNAMPDTPEKVTHQLDTIYQSSQHLEVLTIKQIEEYRVFRNDLQELNDRLIAIATDKIDKYQSSLNKLQRTLSIQTIVVGAIAALVLANFWHSSEPEPHSQPKIPKKAEVAELIL